MMYRNPFIPKEKANLAIVDGRITEEIEQNLIELGVDIVKTIKCESTYEAIAYHPDVVMHPVNDKDIVVAPSVFEYYKDKLDPYGFNLIKGELEVGMVYPHNIGYNVGRVGKLAIHKLGYTDPVLKNKLDEEGVEWVYVKQGYAKCSTLTVGHNHVITADKGIAKTLENQYGVIVCTIDPGYIELEGMEYGFVGGTGGMISERELVLSGSYDAHKSKKNIEVFLESIAVDIRMASNSRILDLGSILFLKGKRKE